jgi:hypothetical protein
MSGYQLRFSLLTMLLLMILAACGITIWQLWSEVGPLREENRRMRAELGLLTIEDPKRAYAINIPTFEDDLWKWRINLPPGNQYSLCEYSGHLPTSRSGKSWFDEVKASGVGSSSSGSGLQGEFVLEARLIKENGEWLMVTKARRHDGEFRTVAGSKTSIYPPLGNWLSEHRSRISSSDVADRQKSFTASEPILLLHLIRPEITDLPRGGYTSRSPQGPADGVAIWLEPRPAGTNTKTSLRNY